MPQEIRRMKISRRISQDAVEVPVDRKRAIFPWASSDARGSGVKRASSFYLDL